MTGVPTDAEIHAAAADLGLLVDGEVPPAKRARIAKSVVVSRREQAEDAPRDVLLSRSSHNTEAGLITVEVRLQPHSKENRT